MAVNYILYHVKNGYMHVISCFYDVFSVWVRAGRLEPQGIAAFIKFPNGF
ncbi:hypothetical protein HMPREF0083_04637 [Aneurinibacillus aneurinilyticus ATCC 12856]|uniref:Uncharacterized protein n=1 Tax=Aneurinibacillus aneurinilyticus ATCC 12856 TaxID=649747 RepID=U1Y550_ANEAE|nr:hypothetical protein HMPREF0083_04637 [Aneurinibacillus aneurinilyticus ATCC 12856]